MVYIDLKSNKEVAAERLNLRLDHFLSFYDEPFNKLSALVLLNADNPSESCHVDIYDSEITFDNMTWTGVHWEELHSIVWNKGLVNLLLHLLLFPAAKKASEKAWSSRSFTALLRVTKVNDMV